jgi:hypothetical protein
VGKWLTEVRDCEIWGSHVCVNDVRTVVVSNLCVSHLLEARGKLTREVGRGSRWGNTHYPYYKHHSPRQCFAPRCLGSYLVMSLDGPVRAFFQLASYWLGLSAHFGPGYCSEELQPRTTSLGTWLFRVQRDSQHHPCSVMNWTGVLKLANTLGERCRLSVERTVLHRACEGSGRVISRRLRNVWHLLCACGRTHFRIDHTCLKNALFRASLLQRMFWLGSLKLR